MRPGAEYFTKPDQALQRRYEALRCYFVEGLPAPEVARRFGYTPATVIQLASELRCQWPVRPDRWRPAELTARGHGS